MLERILDNAALKLLALAMAFVIWLSVTGENRILQDVSVPLDIQLPESRVLTINPPNTVTVRLRGAESQMRRLDPAPLAIRVDLDDTAIGERDVQLSRADLTGVPRGIEVDFIDPGRVRLAVDLRQRRELPLEPVFIGRPPAGFAFYGSRISPPTILVEGPQTEVEPMVRLETDPIRLDTRRGSFTRSVRAVPAEPHVRVVDSRPVDVWVAIYGSPIEKRFENVPIEFSGQTHEIQSDSREVTVALTGPPEILEALSRARVHARVDLSRLAPGNETHNLTVQVEIDDLPAEELARPSVQSISPPDVAVSILDRRLEP